MPEYTIPVNGSTPLDFGASSSFPPDTDPAHILGEVARYINELKMVPVRVYHARPGGALYFDFKHVTTRLDPCEWCDGDMPGIAHSCRRHGQLSAYGPAPLAQQEGAN